MDFQYGWIEVSVLYSPDPIMGICSDQNFVSDFQNSVSDINITITFSKQMTGTEVSVKRALQTAMKYSRGHHWIKFIFKKNICINFI